MATESIYIPPSTPTGIAGGSLTGTYPNPTIATIPSGATGTTQSAGDNSTKVATTAYVDASVGGIVIGAAVSGSTVAYAVLTETFDNKVDNSTALRYIPGTGLSATEAITTTINALTTTTVPGFLLQNNTAATSGVQQQNPPANYMLGHQWTGAADSIVGWRTKQTSSQTRSTVTLIRDLDYTVDGTTYTNFARYTAGTGMAITGNFTCSGGITVGTSLIVGTTLGVTNGNINVNGGNVVISTSGKTIDVETSTAASAAAGTATLVAGTVTVSTTAVLTGDLIFLTMDTPGGTTGVNYSAPVGSISNATSFVINSVSAAGAVVVTDTSTVRWWIVHRH